MIPTYLIAADADIMGCTPVGWRGWLRRADPSILRDPTRVVGRHLTLGRADDGAQQASK
jgi:hypothetical protein